MNLKLSFVLFIFLICSFSLVYASNQTMPLLGKVIYVDIGHGRYYYTKTNKIDVKALNNTLNDSENIVFFICQVMPFFAFFSILPH